MNKEATKREIKVKELVWYIIAGVLAVLALTSLVFGIVGHYLPGNLDDNFIKQAEKAIVLDFRTWGVIVLAAAAIIATIDLLVFAKSSDREVEKTLRRQQRLANSSALNEMEIKPAVQTVEVEAKPVEPAPVKEEAPTEEKPAEPVKEETPAEEKVPEAKPEA